MQDPAVILALQQKEAMVKEQERREQELQRQLYAMEKQAEQLEMERLRGFGGNQQNNNNAAMLQYNMKEKAMEMAMVENQIAQLKIDQKAFLDAQMEAQRVYQMQMSQ